MFQSLVLATQFIQLGSDTDSNDPEFSIAGNYLAGQISSGPYSALFGKLLLHFSILKPKQTFMNSPHLNTNPTPSTRFASLVFLIALLLTPQYAFAQSESKELDDSKFDINMLDMGKTHWHGIYIGGKKSGFMNSTFERRTGSGQPTIASVTRTELQLLVQGRETKMRTLEVVEFEIEKPYRMVAGYSAVENQLGRTTITAKVEDETLTAKIKEATKQRDQKIDNFKYTLPQVASFALMGFDEAEPEDTFEFKQFSVADLRFDEQTVKYVGNRDSVIDGVKVKYHEADVTSKTNNATGRFRFGPEMELFSAVIGNVFEMRQESEEQARNIGFSADLAVLGVMKLNQPIGDPAKVKALELLANNQIAEAIAIGPMQQAELRGNGYVVKLGRKHGVPTNATPLELKENVKETVDYPISDPEVQHMMKQAIGSETDVRKQIQKLIPYVSNYLEDSLNDNAISVLDIIRRRRGDCTEHAKLFATLARAAEIPAREVGGFIYLGDDAKSFGAHAWNEVVIDGKWWPVDPMWNETNINATHIQLKDQSQLFSLGTTLQLLNIEKK